MSSTSRAGRVSPHAQHEAAQQIRRSLTSAGLALGLLLAITLVSLFTPALDGHVGGVGYGYIAGFVDFVVVMVIATLHCRRANREDAEVVS